MKQDTKNIFFDVQRYIYQSLVSTKTINKDLKIFNQIPKNTPFPYLYLGKFKLVNRSVKGLGMRLHWVNEIHLYSQNHSIEHILCWCDSIKNALRTNGVDLGSSHITTIELIEMALDTMQDAKTTQVIFKFRIIAEEKDGLIQWLLNAA